MSVFKGRTVDPTREKDTAVERCDVSVEDGENNSKSRFIVKIFCRHGMFTAGARVQVTQLYRGVEDVPFDI